jgi:ferritin-like protein
MNDKEPLLQFFAYAHLPTHLQSTSAQFHDLAHSIVGHLPRNPERTTALRKLLEAKDCSVRAMLWKDE